MSDTPMPFLEQVKLFSETMNERFVENDSSKSLLVFAMDTKVDGEQKVNYLHCIYGSDFDLAYCIARARNTQDIDKLFELSSMVLREINKRSKK